MIVLGTVGRRGQITLPRAIREQLKVQEGDRVLFERRGDEIVLRAVGRTLAELRGSVPVSAEQDFSAIRQQVIAEHARKVAEGDR